MQQLTNQQRLKPWMGFVLFTVTVAFLFFIGSAMQTVWGVAGLVATEAGFLIIAIAYALIFRIPLKEMFPIKKFTFKDFFGAAFLVGGGVSFGMISILIVGMLYPASLNGSDVKAFEMLYGEGAGYIFMMFAISLMPAICEEAIQRGAIIANFRTIKKDWVIVLIMGLFFGLFHLSALRFINTAIMGACLSYIVVKKNNILLSAIMHFSVNFLSSSYSWFVSVILNGSGNRNLSEQVAQLTPEAMKSALPSYLFMGLAAPFFIVLGLMLLNPVKHKKIRFLFAGIVTAIMFVSGVAIAATSLNTQTVVKTNMSYTIDIENSDSSPVEFNIADEGSYSVAVVIMNVPAESQYSVRIEKANGKVVSNGMFTSSAFKTYTKQIGLEPGDYRLYIVNGFGTKGEKPAVSVQINKI